MLRPATSAANGVAEIARRNRAKGRWRWSLAPTPVGNKVRTPKLMRTRVEHAGISENDGPLQLACQGVKYLWCVKAALGHCPQSL